MRAYLLGTTMMMSAAMFSNAVLADGGPAPQRPPPPPPPAKAETGIELELRGYAQFGLAGIISEPEYFGLDRDGVDAIIGTPHPCIPGPWILTSGA